jgi:excisionase family DNA binding protein
MIAIQDEKFLSITEVAAMFDKRPTTVIDWIRDGKLERVKAGGTTLIPESALLKMLEGE